MSHVKYKTCAIYVVVHSHKQYPVLPKENSKRKAFVATGNPGVASTRCI